MIGLKASTLRLCLMLLGLSCLSAGLVFPQNALPEQNPDQNNDVQGEFTFTIVLSEKSCQMAIWLVDDQGAYADTVLVTNKTAQKGLGNRGGAIDDKWGGSRISTLPVWAYQRGVDYGSGNYYPPKNEPLPDAISAATPKAGEFVWHWKPAEKLEPGKYDYFIEVNKSFDENTHHDYSWYRGQPSLVWRGTLLVGNQVSRSEAKIVGHGHPAGKDGHIYQDTSTLTTALNLIEKASVVFRPVHP